MDFDVTVGVPARAQVIALSQRAAIAVRDSTAPNFGAGALSAARCDVRTGRARDEVLRFGFAAAGAVFVGLAARRGGGPRRIPMRWIRLVGIMTVSSSQNSKHPITSAHYAAFLVGDAQHSRSGATPSCARAAEAARAGSPRPSTRADGLAAFMNDTEQTGAIDDPPRRATFDSI